MNNDFGKSGEVIMQIMTNVSALKDKIDKEKTKPTPRAEKIIIWQRELKNAEKALDKRRVMA